jgi:hypothetical protein
MKLNKDCPTPDKEDARLLSILTDCRHRVKVHRDALAHPTGSMLFPQYQNLVNDLAMLQVERAGALATLRRYRAGRRGHAALIAGAGAS